jgi:hypothetical protein
MIAGKVIWPPSPFKAGFCITDDTDAATFEQIKTVYDFLISRNFLTSKTVWPFEPSDGCGIPATPSSTLRGVTLQNKQYLAYCKMLRSRGYEICLHGASAGNNLRESTKNAFEFLKKEIGYSDTFICHSKNAENIYWNDKVTSLFPFHILLKLTSKSLCSGETPSSPYFWGDICHDTIRQIRLYRTRCINTLKRNPSMPYFCPDRPFVNGWFSATKRSLSDCAQKEELERLVEENGLTVLYQYLHRYAGPDGHNLNRRFMDAIEALASGSAIMIDTVSNIMRRLRVMQRIFFFCEGTVIWLVNTNDSPVSSLQIILDKPVHLSSAACTILVGNNVADIMRIPANAVVRIESNTPLRVKGPRCFALHGRKTICRNIGTNARLYLNLSDSAWQIPSKTQIGPVSFLLEAQQTGTDIPPVSPLPILEESSLLLGQLWIVAREILFSGRSLNSAKYLDDSKEIKLENHDNW